MKFRAGLICLFIVCLAIGTGFARYKTDIYKKLTYKTNRILVCITSYKRPIFLSGQLLRFKNQTYKDFHISVAVKGVPQQWANKTFMKEWQPLIDSGLVSLKFTENGPQLQNFLDTVRDVDLSKYDYFCKVDDDDWYTPDYLESVNDYLNQEKDIVLTHSTNTVILSNGPKKAKDVSMFKNMTVLSGPTMCMSRALIENLLKLEKDQSALEPDIPKSKVFYSQFITEDNLFDIVAQSMGKVQYRESGEPKVIYGQQYPSVTRGDYR